MGERTEAPPVADEARRASEKIRSIATKWARYDYIFEWAMKNPTPATKKERGKDTIVCTYSAFFIAF